jgi:hypothetical protein
VRLALRWSQRRLPLEFMEGLHISIGVRMAEKMVPDQFGGQQVAVNPEKKVLISSAGFSEINSKGETSYQSRGNRSA